jgi:hypothetical protein
MKDKVIMGRIRKLMEDRQSVDGGRYDGRSLTGDGGMILGGRKHFGGGHYISGLAYFLVLGVWFWGFL